VARVALEATGIDCSTFKNWPKTLACGDFLFTRGGRPLGVHRTPIKFVWRCDDFRFNMFSYDVAYLKFVGQRFILGARLKRINAQMRAIGKPISAKSCLSFETLATRVHVELSSSPYVKTSNS